MKRWDIARFARGKGNLFGKKNHVKINGLWEIVAMFWKAMWNLLAYMRLHLVCVVECRGGTLRCNSYTGNLFLFEFGQQNLQPKMGPMGSVRAPWKIWKRLSKNRSSAYIRKRGAHIRKPVLQDYWRGRLWSGCEKHKFRTAGMIKKMWHKIMNTLMLPVVLRIVHARKKLKQDETHEPRMLTRMLLHKNKVCHIFYRTLLWNTLAWPADWHSGGTLLLDTIAQHFL